MAFLPAGMFALMLALPSDVMLAVQARPAVQPQNQFFSGTVTALTAGSVTVSRTLLGKNSETRTFTIDAHTGVEGKLQVKSRVTVRYADDRAVHIIVRPPKR